MHAKFLYISLQVSLVSIPLHNIYNLDSCDPLFKFSSETTISTLTIYNISYVNQEKSRARKLHRTPPLS